MTNLMLPDCTPIIVLAIIFIVSVNFFRMVLNEGYLDNHHKVRQKDDVARDENKKPEGQG